MTCLYIATVLAMLLELGFKQTDKIAFHLQFLPILIIFMLVMFNVYGLFSLVRKRLADIFLNLIVAVANIYIFAMAITFFFRSFDYSRIVLLYSGVFSLVLLFIWNYICHQWEIKKLPQYTGILFCGFVFQCLPFVHWRAFFCAPVFLSLSSLHPRDACGQPAHPYPQPGSLLFFLNRILM